MREPDTQPSVGLVYHGSSSATGIVSVDGTAAANDTATVTIEDRSYTYTVQAGIRLDSIRDALVSLINQDPKVTAEASGVFDRILLRRGCRVRKATASHTAPAPTRAPA